KLRAAANPRPTRHSRSRQPSWSCQPCSCQASSPRQRPCQCHPSCQCPCHAPRPCQASCSRQSPCPPQAMAEHAAVTANTSALPTKSFVAANLIARLYESPPCNSRRVRAAHPESKKRQSIAEVPERVRVLRYDRRAGGGRDADDRDNARPREYGQALSARFRACADLVSAVNSKIFPSFTEAVRDIPDGAVIGFGGFAVVGMPI